MQLYVRRYAPFSQFGGGFEGDNRSVSSTSLTATSRTSGSVFFDRRSIGRATGGRRAGPAAPPLSAPVRRRRR